jgi:hypothetical protein
MHRLAKAGAVAVLAALVIGSSAAAVVRSSERVRLVDATPVTLQGVNFRPLERVSVSLSLGSSDVHRVLRAGPSGRFVTVFPKLRYDRCNGALEVRAVGSRGSRAGWKIVPLDCPDGGADS